MQQHLTNALSHILLTWVLTHSQGSIYTLLIAKIAKITNKIVLAHLQSAQQKICSTQDRRDRPSRDRTFFV